MAQRIKFPPRPSYLSLPAAVLLVTAAAAVSPLAAQNYTFFHTFFGAGVPGPVAGPSLTCYPTFVAADPNRALCEPVEGVSSLTLPGATATFQTNTVAGESLKSGATVTVTNTTADYFSAFSRTGYADVVTFGGGVIPSFMRFAVAGDGLNTSTDPRCETTLFIAGVCPYGALTFSNWGASFPPQTGRTPNSFNVFLGGMAPDVTAFIELPVLGNINNIRFGLSAVASISRPEGLSADDPWSGIASANFLNSAFIRDVRFLDATRLDITNRVQAEWSSGIRYAAVPEPASAALLVAGIAGLIAIAPRRRRQLEPAAQFSEGSGT